MRGCWEAAVEIDRRLALARQFGTFTQAYSTAVQEGLEGHADFKRRFCGVEEQTYYASDCLFNDFRVIASLKTAGAL